MCENCQGQICLTIGAKMIGGGRPLLRKILSQGDRVRGKFEHCDNSETIRDRMSAINH